MFSIIIKLVADISNQHTNLLLAIPHGRKMNIVNLGPKASITWRPVKLFNIFDIKIFLSNVIPLKSLFLTALKMT